MSRNAVTQSSAFCPLLHFCISRANELHRHPFFSLSPAAGKRQRDCHPAQRIWLLTLQSLLRPASAHWPRRTVLISTCRWISQIRKECAPTTAFKTLLLHSNMHHTRRLSSSTATN